MKDQTIIACSWLQPGIVLNLTWDYDHNCFIVIIINTWTQSSFSSSSLCDSSLTCLIMILIVICEISFRTATSTYRYRGLVPGIKTIIHCLVHTNWYLNLNCYQFAMTIHANQLQIFAFCTGCVYSFECRLCLEWGTCMGPNWYCSVWCVYLMLRMLR